MPWFLYQQKQQEKLQGIKRYGLRPYNQKRFKTHELYLELKNAINKKRKEKLNG